MCSRGRTATFALAIGANTAIFSLLNAVVLRAVSVSDPDRLVAISTTDTQTTQPGFIYVDTFTAFRAEVVPGVLIGVPCALAAATLVRSQLYGLALNDPATIIGAAVIFIVTGFVAALVPALRASKIDPMDALRQE